jgi:hypothetical protein
MTQTLGMTTASQTVTSVLGDHPVVQKPITLKSVGATLTLKCGTVLARAFGTTVTEGSENVGDGAMGTVTLKSAAVPETFTLTCTAESLDAGTFSVVGSKTGVHADLTVGTAYDNGFFAVTLADGAEDFDEGDTFTITVEGGTYERLDPDSSSGKQTAVTVLLEDVTVPASGNEKAVALAHGVVVADNLVFTHTGITDEEKAQALADLEAVGIYHV